MGDTMTILDEFDLYDGVTAQNDEQHVLAEKARRHMWLHFSRMGVYSEDKEIPIMVRGEGAYIWDQRGKKYLDGISSLFTSQLGHGRADLAEAAAEQAKTLAYFPQWTYAHPTAINLAEKLASLAPGDLNRVFFTSGGAEGVESAWKLARQYHHLNGDHGRYKVISRDIAKQLGQPALKGFYITRVYPNTTAATAGIKPGDFIVAVDGEKLTASDSEYEDELSTLIRQYDIGKKVDLSVIRGKESLQIPVELVRSPRLKREMKKYRNEDFEFTAREVSFFDTVEEQWSGERRGVLVEDVKSGSWAELGSLSDGDLILEVNGQPVDNVDALRRQMERIAANKEKVVVIKVQRGIHTSYLEIEPNWKN